MNTRKWVYLSLLGLRGQPLGKYYRQFFREYQTGKSTEISQRYLEKIFQHCEQYVPYYSNIMQNIEGSYQDDPIEYLRQFPILTKEIIRSRFAELTSLDLPQRKWYLNSSGGSTGEPVQLIQDWDYAAQAGAIKALFSKLVGKDIGEREVRLWGNLHDITSNSEGWQAHLSNLLENVVFVNSQLMSPERIRGFVHILNHSKPKLILAYADAIYQIAKFADRERLFVEPQSAILTSAFQLYPFMRTKIEEVFKCNAFDRYGSREVGDVACERPNFDGLWVAPWGNYLEIVDTDGNRVPDGTEGEILITSLRNYAMPLIRYKIGDRGLLNSPSIHTKTDGQVLKEITGRSMDLFKTQDGALINSGFFMANLYFRDWIARYQIIQKDYLKVIYKMVTITDPPKKELEDIIAITKKVLGGDCEVVFEFVDEISPSPSGKFRFLLSEVG